MQEFKQTGPDQPVFLTPSPPRLFARLTSLSRAGEWWAYKLGPGLAVLYATAFRTGAGAIEVAQMGVLYVVALAAGAAFVSAVNDLSDRDDDRRAGKPDRIGANTVPSLIIIAVSVGAGLVFLSNFAAVPFLFWTYAAGWLAFAAYSLPPLRLKAKAAAGVACDAVGAHVVPAVFALALVQRETMSPFDPWLWAIVGWALACGLRGIISHQLSDEPFDRAAGIETFVIRFGPHGSRLLVRYLFFPVELATVIAMLVLIGSPIPIFGLAASALFLVGKTARFGTIPVLTGPAPRQAIVLADFYIVFLPLALLFALAWKDGAFTLLIPAHMLLFPANISATIRDLARLPKEVLE